MANTAALNDFSQASALSAAQHQSRINAMRANKAGAGDSNFPRNSAARGAKGEEDVEDENLPYQIYLLEQRGKELKKAALKDEMAAESMEISNTWVDMVAGGVIEVGKATVEIIIGFLILPAGFIMKAVKFFFDRQITSLKSSSQNKNKQGDKFLAQAAKLRGKQAPIKRAADAATSAAKNYIAELLAEFFPFGFSPLVIFESAKEKQKSLYKILLRAVFFFVTIGISIALIIIFIYLILENVCDKIPLCKPAVKIFGAEIVSQAVAK